jgi:FkbM family methyltransferase
MFRVLEPGAVMHYSAYGEDVIVLGWLDRIGIPLSSVRYLDIGAAHPTHLSNTYLFYRMKGSGVLVEPDPRSSEKLRKKRPRDTVVAAGVAIDDRRSAKLTCMSSPFFNTFVPGRGEDVAERSKQWLPGSEQHVTCYIDCPMVPINEILSEHFRDAPPHLLSIDTEGDDLQILQSMDKRHRPLAIVIEASRTTAVFHDVLGPDYHLVARTPDNFVFVRDELARSS